MHLPKVFFVFMIFSLLLSVTFLPQASSAGNTVEDSHTIEYPAHYIVFKYSTDGTILPDTYQTVKMSSPIQSLSEAQLTKALSQPERNMLWLVVLLQDKNGSIVFRDVVAFSPWLRGEFHKATPEQGIDGHLIPLKSSAFVVRLPYLEDCRLILQDSRVNTLAEFDMTDLIAQTPHYQANTIPLSVEDGIMNGSPANRVDMVVLGDGYTAEQSEQFIANASAVMQQFFSISPLNEYSNYYNLYMLATDSTQSGSDHPPYNPSCGYTNPTCCSDPEMLSDPLQGQMVDTAFDSRYCAYGIHRLLVANMSKVFAAAGAVPDWDQILLIVNDATYGGSGSTSLAVVSMHSLAYQIAQHEYGHSFANLADEYTSPYPGYPGCSDLPGSSRLCESNVTDITERAEIKWLPWILEDTPIPTPNNPSYDGVVGLFEGARYMSTGMYRSGYSCIMRALGEPFCQVPSQSYVLKLYEGGWGDPMEGIRLIEPGTTTPISTTLNLTYPVVQVFSADILSPVGGPPVAITWLDNGIPVPGAVTDTFTYTTSADSLGWHEITLHVEDITLLVNPLMENGALGQDYTWNVEVSVPVTVAVSANPTTIFADGVSTSTITATVTGNDLPISGVVVTFTTTLGDISPITTTTDVSGIATATLTSGNFSGIATVSVSVGSSNNSVDVEFVGLPRMYIPMVSKR